ncbi:hypothetical protein D3227_33110 [Mesorhizobium waimense]|uniref:Uncharacterized protein n=1 Tax=Mesorhizobium waimense TaxID=1300307 RepID=A0A3A5K0T6_9HYPH|nr:hypothetical protein [Mesorhizobium waimense]RJT28927.1 hypothetical protein D3227_33110 [Mesorhizobium waimense]
MRKLAAPIKDLPRTLKRLQERGSSLATVALLFPDPAWTLDELEAAGAEVGRKLMEVMAAAEGVGRFDIAKEARDSADLMQAMIDRVQARLTAFRPL